MRLSSLIENDIAGLESGHRGYLLSANENYIEPFEKKRDLIRQRVDDLTVLILENPRQRKRVIKVQEAVQKWLDTVATPEMSARRRAKGTATKSETNPAGTLALGNALLNQARQVLQSLQDEEQIVLNQRMHDQDWATQSAQILNFLPKLDRAVLEMEKEKRGCLLTGENSFVEAYKRAVTDFYTYNGYLSILVANSPAQAELLAEIRSTVEGWINKSAVPQIDAKRASKDAEVLALIGSGETLMADIRQMLTNFEKNELSHYELRASLATRQRILRTSALALLALVAVSLLVVSNSYSFVLVRRQLSELEGAETHIRSVIDNILDGMITVDDSGVIRSMNPSAEKMFGCRDNEMIGHNLTRLVPKRYESERDSKPVVCNWTELMGRTRGSTLALGRTRKHVTFPVEMSLSEMIIDQQRAYVAMVRDVTERNRFEQQIAAEKESLGVTLRAIGDGVITTDVNGKVIMLNSEAEKLTGWSSKEGIGQPLKSVFDVTIDLAAQAKAQKSGYRSEAQSILLNLPESVTLTSRDGNERVIEQVASPIRDNKNEVAGVVLVFRDITARQRAETERRKAETLEQLGLLAGGIAHDFNNLLTAIIGNISLASVLLPPNDEMAERLDDAKNASLRARDLAQQLLTFARGGTPIKKTASIGKLIQDTVSFSLRGSHNRSEFEFGVDLSSAEIDAGQISQVIANLVVNADQAMPNGGTLHVSCENFSYSATTTPAMPGTGRVLVVDDEDAIRDLVEFTLTRLGYKVWQAATALEGVNIYREKFEADERFDAVILDLTLPGGIGGKEALKKLIEIDPTVNAIVSSGYATDATMSRYQDFGFRGVIAKPYEAAELGKIVHDVIESSHVNIIDYPTQAAG